jgi:hypothetical protein
VAERIWRKNYWVDDEGGFQMANTFEDLLKKANDTLEGSVRIPVILNKLAERGFTPKTKEEADELLKVAQAIGQKVAAGEIAPIPASALEQDGQLSKHAEDKASQDFLAFAPEYTLEPEKFEDGIRKSAALIVAGAVMTA